MKNAILNVLRNTWGLLIFALLSGGAYYAVILRFILANTSIGGGLLGFFLLPLVVCGAALVIVKVIRQCLDSERETSAVTVFLLHVLFILIGIVFLISIFI